MPVDENGLYVDGYLKSNLDLLKEAIKKNWDFVLVVDGLEGAGKSKLARQVGAYLDNNFSIKNIVFTSKEFTDAVMTQEKYSCIIWDEAINGAYIKETMNSINKTLVKMFAQIRQKNLFIILVIPSFFELSKYLAIHRSRALIHVYTDDELNRGYFRFYNYETKKELFIKGKLFYNYCVKANFYARFTKYDPVDEKEYEEKKRNSLMVNEDDKKSDLQLLSVRQRSILAFLLWQFKGVSQPKIAELVDSNKHTVGDWCERGRKEVGDRLILI